MSPNHRKTVAYLDLEAVRPAAEAAGATPVAFAEKAVALARGYGRLLSATAYGDIGPDEGRELRRIGAEARPTSEEGEGSAPESIAIALDAAEAMGAGPAVEVVLLASDDAQLAELVRRLRRHGRYVVAVVPAAFSAQEPARGADRAVAVEALLAGSVEPEVIAAPEQGGRPPRREREPRPPRAPLPPLDLENHDWTRLVLLMRDLEAKMPFVGMRWLKNKVIGPHNVGAASLADKQALLNKAVDLGILETYRVGNRDEGGEPVTACRLLRENDRVRGILIANPPAPEPEGEQAPAKEDAPAEAAPES